MYQYLAGIHCGSSVRASPFLTDRHLPRGKIRIWGAFTTQETSESTFFQSWFSGSFQHRFFHLISHMLHSPYNISPNLCPVDRRVQFFVNEPDNSNILASYKIKTMCYLDAWFGIVWRSDNAFYGLAENEIGELITR